MKPKIHLHVIKNHCYGDYPCWIHRPTGVIVIKKATRLYVVKVPKVESPKCFNYDSLKTEYCSSHMRGIRKLISSYWLSLKFFNLCEELRKDFHLNEDGLDKL